MVRVLCAIAYLGLMCSIEPHFHKEHNVITAFAYAFLEVVKVFCFYFMCRMVSVQARYWTTSWLFWFVFEKLLLPVAIVFSLLKYLDFSPLIIISLSASILILIDPLDTIGLAMRASLVGSEKQPTAGVAVGGGKTFLDYLPALILAAALYLVGLY